MKHLTKIAAMFCLLSTCQFGLAMNDAASYVVFNKLQKIPFGTLNNLILLKDLCDDDELCSYFGAHTKDRKFSFTANEMRFLFGHLMTRDYSSALEWELLLNQRKDWGQAATSSDQHGVIHRSYKNGIKEHILLDSDHIHYKAILEFYRENLEPITISGSVSELAMTPSTTTQSSSSSSSSSVAATTALSSESSFTAAANTTASSSSVTSATMCSCTEGKSS